MFPPEMTRKTTVGSQVWRTISCLRVGPRSRLLGMVLFIFVNRFTLNHNHARTHHDDNDNVPKVLSKTVTMTLFSLLYSLLSLSFRFSIAALRAIFFLYLSLSVFLRHQRIQSNFNCYMFGVISFFLLLYFCRKLYGSVYFSPRSIINFHLNTLKQLYYSKLSLHIRLLHKLFEFDKMDELPEEKKKR